MWWGVYRNNENIEVLKPYVGIEKNTVKHMPLGKLNWVSLFTFSYNF